MPDKFGRRRYALTCPEEKPRCCPSTPAENNEALPANEKCLPVLAGDHQRRREAFFEQIRLLSYIGSLGDYRLRKIRRNGTMNFLEDFGQSVT